MLFNFFKKKKVHFLGRGGLIFKYQNHEYFIDSEMSFTGNVDLVVFKDTVKRKDNSEMVTGELKDEVLMSLLDYLKNKEHLRVELFQK